MERSEVDVLQIGLGGLESVARRCIAQDVDGRAPGNLGAWETSGIVDASAVFGRGAFLIDVQAHTLWIEKAPGDDNNGDGQPDFTYKREGGQLALIRIPGA